MKLEDARQLDWQATERAAQEIIRTCRDAGFCAPEDLVKARELIVHVCRQLDSIAKALLITPPRDMESARRMKF